MTYMERTSSRVVVLFLTGHALAAAWTWRIASAVNTLGSAGYWLIGRRYRSSQPR